jgi:hypothetical protein
MKQLYRLAIPESIEFVFFLIVSVVLLLSENIKRFWVLLGGDTIIIAKQKGSIDNTFKETLTNLINNINPKIVDFLVWILIGCVVFVIISVIIAFIKSLENEAELLSYYRSPKSRAQEINSFLTKLAVRFIGILGIILWFIYFIKVINPAINRWFFTSLTSLKSPSSWFWLAISIVLFTFCIYLFAVLFRIIALRPRIFAKQSE